MTPAEAVVIIVLILAGVMSLMFLAAVQEYHSRRRTKGGAEAQP